MNYLFLACICNSKGTNYCSKNDGMCNCNTGYLGFDCNGCDLDEGYHISAILNGEVVCCLSGYGGHDCNTCESGHYVSAIVNGTNYCTGPLYHFDFHIMLHYITVYLTFRLFL